MPIYLSSLFMWPIVHFADEPYLGRKQRLNRRRSHQGSLLMLEALHYIREAFPFWNASAGRDHVWMMLHDEGPCFCPLAIRQSILLTHYGYYSETPKPWGTFYDDNFFADKGFYRKFLGDPDRPTRCFKRGRDLVLPPWKMPTFWRKMLAEPSLRLPGGAKGAGTVAKGGGGGGDKPRSGLVFFAGDLGFKRLKGYSHDLRQKAHGLYCDPHKVKVKNCTDFVYGCRPEIPQLCELWEPGVSIMLHAGGKYHAYLLDHTFCLAFPGDGWSSRVLDAVVHGCIPVIVQDESEMFFEGAFAAAGLGFDYADFSVRIAEDGLRSLVSTLKAIPQSRVAEMRARVLLVRDYFVYKDMYSPDADERRELLKAGRPNQDAFLLLAMALEARARDLGRLPKAVEAWRPRNRKLLGVGKA